MNWIINGPVKTGDLKLMLFKIKASVHTEISKLRSHEVYSITALVLFRLTHAGMCINASYMW